ncbi:DUF1802 family protein [Pseudanabaena sp. BC1403]|uniref:DUF1802 family protein n=1 Tax=Pseudanabaena sp. BC1403 TaxID=2043171 RepID=UPI000CD81E3F|nr:DUF1802 family protein [Pseudanabaena sp. BC1403]
MISIANGLRISATNLDALKSGKIVGAFSKTFLALDKCFALYPDIQVPDSETINVEFWAECKNCESINNTFPLSNLSKFTALSLEELERIFQQRANIFLLSLRVYQLPNPIQVQPQATGNFVPLSEAVTIINWIPILNDEQFQEAQKQFQSIDLSVIPNEISTASIMAEEFLEINPSFLDGFIEADPNTTVTVDLVDENSSTQIAYIEQPNESESDWIKTISTLGDRSIKEDEGKSNYQAGTDFENIVRKALEFLGFKADYTHKGGAGGLDLLCLEPYALFGECKAGKKIPNDTAVQLLNLGTLRRRDLFPKAVKLIIGAGNPTTQLEDAAKAHGMAIINAVTLQKLVELKSNHSGSIDLIELRKYFVGGQSNQEIDKYIEKVTNEMKLRSHIVNLVKRCLETFNSSNVDLNALEGAYHFSNPPQNLSKEELKEMLIELSSPLVGYLGRVEEDGKKCDRFYYLRDLPIE